MLLQTLTQHKKIRAAQFLWLLVCCYEALKLVCKVIIVTLWPLLCSLIGLCRRGCALVSLSLHYDLHCPFLQAVALASIGSLRVSVSSSVALKPSSKRHFITLMMRGV